MATLIGRVGEALDLAEQAVDVVEDVTGFMAHEGQPAASPEAMPDFGDFFGDGSQGMGDDFDFTTGPTGRAATSGKVTDLVPGTLDRPPAKFAVPVAMSIMSILGSLAVELGAEVLANEVVKWFESDVQTADALEGALRGDQGRPGADLGSFTGELNLSYCGAIMQTLNEDTRAALGQWNGGLRRPIGLTKAQQNIFWGMLLSHAPRTLTNPPHACGCAVTHCGC